MKNLLLLLLLANILYFLWDRYIEAEPEVGVAVVKESELGPPLEVSDAAIVDSMVGAGKPSELAAVVGKSCVTVGPFTTEQEAELALGDYVQEGMRANTRTTQGQVFVGHWVQIKDIPNRTMGNQILTKLKAGGMADAYLVPSDDDGLKISLGLFGEVERAERVELQAKSMDFAAEITPRTREATIFFVDIELPPGKGAEAIMLKYGEEKVLLRAAAICPRGS